jgi:hypothetical protein
MDSPPRDGTLRHGAIPHIMALGPQCNVDVAWRILGDGGTGVVGLTGATAARRAIEVGDGCCRSGGDGGSGGSETATAIATTMPMGGIAMGTVGAVRTRRTMRTVGG